MRSGGHGGVVVYWLGRKNEGVPAESCKPFAVDQSREFNLLSSVEASSKAQAKGVRDCVQLLW